MEGDVQVFVTELCNDLEFGAGVLDHIRLLESWDEIVLSARNALALLRSSDAARHDTVELITNAGASLVAEEMPEAIVSVYTQTGCLLRTPWHIKAFIEEARVFDTLSQLVAALKDHDVLFVSLAKNVKAYFAERTPPLFAVDSLHDIKRFLLQAGAGAASYTYVRHMVESPDKKIGSSLRNFAKRIQKQYTKDIEAVLALLSAPDCSLWSGGVTVERSDVVRLRAAFDKYGYLC